MKRISLALAIFVSLMIPSKPSFAEWMRAASSKGNVFYVDTKIRKHDGHIYFWELADYLKPSKTGVLSSKTYSEADCEKFRRRRLQDSYHTEPMGRGSSKWGGGPVPDDPWSTPSLGSVSEGVLEKACELAN